MSIRRDNIIAELAMQNTCLAAGDVGCTHRYCDLILRARTALGEPTETGDLLGFVRGLRDELEARKTCLVAARDDLQRISQAGVDDGGLWIRAVAEARLPLLDEAIANTDASLVASDLSEWRADSSPAKAPMPDPTPHSVLADVRDALAAPRGDAGVDARMLALDSVQRLLEQNETLRELNARVIRERDESHAEHERLNELLGTDPEAPLFSDEWGEFGNEGSTPARRPT